MKTPTVIFIAFIGLDWIAYLAAPGVPSKLYHAIPGGGFVRLIQDQQERPVELQKPTRIIWYNDLVAAQKVSKAGDPYQRVMMYSTLRLSLPTERAVEFGLRSDGVVVWREAK